MQSMMLYAVGLPVEDGIQQEHFLTPLTADVRQVWEPALHGIAFEDWFQHYALTADPSATPAEARALFLGFRSSRLMMEWPPLYYGTPGPSASSVVLIAEAEAIPADWPHRALWTARPTLESLIRQLEISEGIARSTTVDVLLPPVLTHPTTYLMDNLPTPTRVVTA